MICKLPLQHCDFTLLIALKLYLFLKGDDFKQQTN